MTRSPVDAEVIADRYLTSPIGVRARPYGPVEALDTHSGRAAQVRIVFVPGEWGEGELADAVAAWCGIGCAEITGVLDFGRHGDRWFLVLPPSLGMPVARWRSLRRPTSADAARLVLAFGRLVERVGAAGFPPDTAELADFAVGPGPTPFLERPLLGPPRPHGVAPPDGDGQRTLAALFRTIVDPARSTPTALGAWAATAAAEGFDSLAACLDELQRAGSVAQAERGDDDEPLGLAGIFDDPPVAPARRRGVPVAVRRIGAVAGAVAAVAAAAMALGAARAPDPATEAPGAPAPNRTLTVPGDAPAPPATVGDPPREPARATRGGGGGRERGDGRGERDRSRPPRGDRAVSPARAPSRREAAPSTTQPARDTGSPASPAPAAAGAPRDGGEQPAPSSPSPPDDRPPQRAEPPGLPPPGGTIELPAP